MKYVFTCLFATILITIPQLSQAGFFSSVPLREGDVSAVVSLIQRELNIVGHSVTAIGEETNYFGVQTVAAVKSFQCAYRIVCSGTGYGIFGPRTAVFLDSIFKKFLTQKSSNVASLIGSGSSLVAEYTFDADTTNVLVDSASSNNATSFGNPSYSAGHIGSAISFDGVDDYLLLPPSPPLPELANNQVSVAFWLKVPALGVVRTLMQERGNSNRGWQLNITAKNQIQFVGYGVAGATGATAIDAINSTEWHYVVLTRDTSVYSVYIDGLNVELATTPTTSAVAGTGGLYIGVVAPASGATPASFAAFSLDDLRFYSRTLSANEAATLYDGIISTPTPTPVPTPLPTITPTITPVPNVGKTILTHTFGGVVFTWEMNCGGNECKAGTFVNGDYWVAPIDVNGHRVNAVTITRIAPEGSIHGAEVNPGINIVNGSTNNKQGILPMYASYNPSYDVMTQLPYAATPGQSIFKAYNKTSGCGAPAIEAGCISTDDVLTVLNDVPPNNGATIFRPPFEGVSKPLFSTDKVKFGRLPALSAISTLTGTAAPQNMSAIINQWQVPHYETAHGAGFSGEFQRATSPSGVIDDYAASQAQQYLQSMLSVFGTQSVTLKTPAVYALIQTGIDDYGAFKLGIPFGTGAGQHLGKKPALTFFASLYDDPSILSEVRSIATNPTYNGFFQEDAQIYRGAGGMVVWGDPVSPDNEARYWSGYIGEWMSRNRGGTGYDSNGAGSDPYGYIDGPGGGPSPTQLLGRNYQFCCSAGIMIDFAFAQHLMPWLEYADGDKEIIEYADRVYTGRNVAGFSGGFWSGNDPCAPMDPRESLSCGPFSVAGRTQCLYYKVTWGPDPDHPGQCIQHQGNTSTSGRWSSLNGVGANTILRLVPSVKSLWKDLRECVDSSKSTYGTGACAGLGSSVPGFIPYNPTLITSFKAPSPTRTPTTIPTPVSTSDNTPLPESVPPTGGSSLGGSTQSAGGSSLGNTLSTIRANTINPSHDVAPVSLKHSTALSNLNVRRVASVSGMLEGVQPISTTGTVTDGPVVSGGHTWWKIDYTTGPDGWSVGDYLSFSSTGDVTESLSTFIHTGSAVYATNNLNTRFAPSITGAFLGIQPISTTGTVTDGPVVSGGHTWWKIDYTTGPDGWSVGDYLMPKGISAPLADISKQHTSIGISSHVILTNDVNTRKKPSANANIVGVHKTKEGGTIIDGPIDLLRHRWWKVDYNNGVDGWSIADYFVLQ